MRTAAFSYVFVLIFLCGCDQGQSQKIADLEKQNQELKAAIEKNRTTEEYDLQAKCSKDAKAWFNENWSQERDKDTMLLTFTNHYSKSMNACFAVVEYHERTDPKTGSWTNDMTLWNVYENSKYGNLIESHVVTYSPKIENIDEVILCEFGNDKCKTKDEFYNFARPYMSN